MKVIQLLSTLGPGGIGNFVAHLTHAELNTPEIENVIAYSQGEGDLEIAFKEQGLKIIPCLKREFYNTRFPYKLNKILRNLENNFYWIKVYRMLRRERPDILHSNEHGASVKLVLFACKLASVKFVIHIHSPSSVYLKNKMNVRIISFLMGRNDRIVVANRDIIEHYQGLIKSCPDNIRVIPYGIKDFKPRELSVKNAIEEKLGIPQNSFVLGYIGRLIPDKNVENLLTSFAELLKSNYDFWLVIIGDGPSRSSLEKMITELGIEKRVFFTGRVPDPDHWVSVFDINVLPTSFEGFPIAVLESFSKEILMVATNVTGCNSIIRHNENGLLYELYNTDELTATLKKAYADKDLRRKLELNARKEFLEKYEINNVSKHFINFYKEMLGSKATN